MPGFGKFPLLDFVPALPVGAASAAPAGAAAVGDLASVITQLAGGGTTGGTSAVANMPPAALPDLTGEALDPVAEIVGTVVAPGFEPTGGALDPFGQSIFGPDFDFAFIGRATTDFAHEAATEIAETLDEPAADPVPNLTTPLAHDIARIGAPDYDPTYGEFGPWEQAIFGTSLDFVAPTTTALIHQPMLQVAAIVEGLGSGPTNSPLAVLDAPLDILGG
ncbi:MAG TPA: hypothetical protein VNK52_03220 [Hyphomicrobiaceae bacterium]|nr:hypothetical protein [Hyphomicrobiaceae bacterium]